MTSNFINTDMASLIRLHNLGLIDDKAFTEAVKKLNTVGSPLSGTPPTTPIPRTDPNHVDVPFIQRTGSGSDDLIKKWTSTGSPLTATFTPTGSGMPMGLATSDIYSGSILKPKAWPGGSSPTYHDCKQSPCQHQWNGYRWVDYSDAREGRLTEADWDYAMEGLLTEQDKEAVKKGRVDVIEYSENRDHLPEHAQMVLNWIDEAWKDKVDEYNETKNDWQRIQYTDEEGNEIVEWIEKIKAEKELEAYKTFLENNVVVEGDDAQLNGLQHIFHLSIGKDEC